MTITELHKLWEKQNKGKAMATEHDLQKSCIGWFRLKHPQYLRLLMAIPNAGRRTKYERRMVLEEGIQHGVPDLFLAIPRKGKGGLWIEMKNGKAGGLGDYQKEMIALLEGQGYACAVCHTLDEFMTTVEEYMK